MLHKKAISSNLLNLSMELLSLPELKEFRLVGGTALALQLGHRKSIDIDFFSDRRLIKEDWVVFISEKFPEAKNTAIVGFGITTTIKGIKVDFCHDGGKFTHPAVEEDGIRMASLEDIAAMKLGAIISRFTKKDYFDIAVLTEKFSLKEMLLFYKAHYPFMDYRVPLESINKNYKADEDIEPVILNGMTWENVKEKLRVWQREFITETKKEKQKQIEQRLKKAETLIAKKKK